MYMVSFGHLLIIRAEHKPSGLAALRMHLDDKEDRGIIDAFHTSWRYGTYPTLPSLLHALSQVTQLTTHRLSEARGSLLRPLQVRGVLSVMPSSLTCACQNWEKVTISHFLTRLEITHRDYASGSPEIREVMEKAQVHFKTANKSLINWQTKDGNVELEKIFHKLATDIYNLYSRPSA